MIAKIFFNIGRILSYIFPHNVSKNIKRCYYKIITGYKSSAFASVGWPISVGKGTSIFGGKSYHIGSNVAFGVATVLEAYSEYGDQRFKPIVSIGNNCSFGDYLHITCINSITIGDNLLTGRRVLISDNNHGTSMRNLINESTTSMDRHRVMDILEKYYTEFQYDTPPINRPLSSKGPIVIGNNVWLADNVCILAGVTIGNGAIIGANTVVTKNIPPYSIAVGPGLRILNPISQDN